MRIISFYSEDGQLKPLELEIALWPGLPTIQFVGQADQALRESALRIKSAIKASGFLFPVAQQILVNLKPTHVRKSSRGLELAVAMAYLWKTDQIPAPSDADLYIYGELGLSGQVEEPGDLRRASLLPGDQVMTGLALEPRPLGFSRRVIQNLSEVANELSSLNHTEPDPTLMNLRRPAWLGHEYVSKSEARLLEIVGAGGHHALLAGPSGSGKSNLARAFHQVLPDVTGGEVAELSCLESGSGEETPLWRPRIEPHHSTPRMAMIGGGNPPQAGELARAHAGLLILDELLEFDPEVIETLRGPFESTEMRVGRLSGVKSFKVDCLIVGTTNLCPCGDLVPGSAQKLRCRFSLKRCQSYSERLSGPILDRFQILYYPPAKPVERDVPLKDVVEKVLQVQAWQSQRSGAEVPRIPHRRALGIDLWKSVDPQVQKIGFTSQSLAERRRLSALRVARSLADLEQEPLISLRHFEEAMSWAVEPFQRLNRWQIDLQR